MLAGKALPSFNSISLLLLFCSSALTSISQLPRGGLSSFLIAAVDVAPPRLQCFTASLSLESGHFRLSACRTCGACDSASLPSSREAAGMRYWINGGIWYLKLDNRSYIVHLRTIIRLKKNFHNCAMRKEESESEAPELPSRSDLRKISRSLKVIRDQSSVLDPKVFEHRYKKWQEQRKDKLTSSTFASAVGFWPGRRFQLWLEKIGAIKPFAGNLATMWNNRREEDAIRDYLTLRGVNVAIEDYKVMTGNAYFMRRHGNAASANGVEANDCWLVASANGVINYPEDGWLAASPDGVLDYDDGLPGVLEIKCPYFDGEKTKAIPWSRVPLYYIPQAQGLMEILDMEWLQLYCWTLNGSTLFRIKRDKTYWCALKDALSDFWFQHVEPGRDELWRHLNPSGELRQQDLGQVLGQFPKSLLPAPRHELCSKLVISSRKIANESVLLGRWDTVKRPKQPLHCR